MTRYLLTQLAVFILSFPIYAQDGNWSVYLAHFENGPGSIIYNADYYPLAPVANLPYVVITGVTVKKCSDDGLPHMDEFGKLHQIEDAITDVVTSQTSSELVGVFTYQCERLSYIYVKDTTSIRDELNQLFSSEYPSYQYEVRIHNDRHWMSYLKFLYPNEEVLSYLDNQKILLKLVSEGDDLTKKRKVNHWLYFSNQQSRESFVQSIMKLGFKIEGKKFLLDHALPYQLQISRIDFIHPESIHKLTLNLRKKASQLNGDYDGWKTVIVKRSF